MAIAAVVLGLLVTVVGAVVIASPGTAVGGGLGGQLADAAGSPGIGAFGTALGGIGVLAGGVLEMSRE